MDFNLWLFVIKRLAQTYDASLIIYQQMSAEGQQELKDEYKQYCSQ